MPTEMDRSSASGLLWELKDLLACNLVSSNVAHNPRSCNLVAHSLAALGASLSSDVMSVRDHIPPCIQTLVANDLASVILQWRILPVSKHTHTQISLQYMSVQKTFLDEHFF
jgi:hypothetical protein